MKTLRSINKYFWNPKPLGLKADIKQHLEEQRKLEDKIIELESISNPDDMQIRALRVYRHFLAQLLQSKADVVSKIGKK
jgi:hypothetical protein